MLPEIKINNLFNKIGRLIHPGSQFTYSQFGEDVILEYLFSELNITSPTYLDIGANDPRIGNNTYKFYRKGFSGVLIEPDPYLYEKISKLRPRDLVLNVGIGIEKDVKVAEYYKFPKWASGLNTFSYENANYWQTIGHKLYGKISVSEILNITLKHINEVLNDNFENSSPDFISIDVEGLDLPILKQIDFHNCKTKVICVETLAYDENMNSYKITAITDFLNSKGYNVFADTRVNTIYFKSDLQKI